MIFSTTERFVSYFDWTGFAAERIDVREFNWHTIPALATEIVCCYIASSKISLLFSSILSNSSIQHIPKSLNTKAPLYKINSLVYGSRRTLAVNPTALEPLPLV